MAPSKTKPLTDQQLETAIQAADLSASSKVNYAARLRNLKRILPDRSLDYMLRHPLAVCDRIRQSYTGNQTRRAHISALLTLFRYNPDVKDMYEKHYYEYRKYLDENIVEGDVKIRNNEPSERQVEGFVPWSEILRVRDTLDKTSTEYLFLCMHTMIPPIRADLNMVAIYVAKKPTEADKAQSPNYMMVSDPSRQCKITLVLTEYKTKTKRHTVYEKELPPALCSIVRQSLVRHPRKYLFVSPRLNEPFREARVYSNFINRLLLKVFKKPLTISMIRHSFISHLDHGKLTSGEKQDLAHDMMHSVSMQDKYRLLFKDDKPEVDVTVTIDGKKKRCTCVDVDD